MLRLLPAAWGPPFGFGGMSVSWLPPGCDPTDPGATADWECAGTMPTTAKSMIMRLSVMTQVHAVVGFIGSLQGVETRSHGARVLRNLLSVSSDPALVPCRVDLIHLVILIFSSDQTNHTSCAMPAGQKVRRLSGARLECDRPLGLINTDDRS